MRTLHELRKYLLGIIPNIENGSLDVKKANAICSASNAVMSLTKLEIGLNRASEFVNEDVIKTMGEKDKKPFVFHRDFKDDYEGRKDA